MTAGLEILNLHAQGGMAEVYRARAVDETGRVWYYAVKRMLPELLSDPEMMRMFLEEQRVAACLLHQNIVRVYDVAQADTSDTFIVMEFLEGRDLSEVIDAAVAKKRILPIWFCLHVAREVLKALHYATTQAKDKSGRILGLIHRDISPHNIFICADGQVKLTDFGVAKVETAEQRTKAGIIKGKFGYMSPEQLSAQALDFRSDLYNVGILLFESLTGTRLFFGETATQFIALMMANEVPPLDKKLLVPPELDALMRKALARKKDERPATPHAFEAQLGAIADRYNLVATGAHIASELSLLFPDLALNPPTDELRVPNTQPEPPPVSVTSKASQSGSKSRASSAARVPRPVSAMQPAPRAKSSAKKLTMMTVAPAALISSAEEQAVFSVSSARPPTRPKPKPPTGRGSIAAADDDDDALVPTLLEPRPTFEELGIDPERERLLASDESDQARTEPTRHPPFIADPPSTTAPGRNKAAGVALSGAADMLGNLYDEKYDDNAPTAETPRLSDSSIERFRAERAAAEGGQVPDAGADTRRSPAPQPPSRQRVSTGSRRVISLTSGDEDKRGGKRDDKGDEKRDKKR